MDSNTNSNSNKSFDNNAPPYSNERCEKYDKEEKEDQVEDQVENFFEKTVVEECQRNKDYLLANVGIREVSDLSSLNYDELNDDTLLFASEWNLTTEDFTDDDMCFSKNETQENDHHHEQSIGGKPCNLINSNQSAIPIISPEDDETMANDISSISITKQNLVPDLKIDTSLDDSSTFLKEFKLDLEEDDMKVEDEIEASRRYLTINSAPMYRWSEGMLPSIPKLQTGNAKITKQDSIYVADETEYLGTGSELLDHEEDKKIYIDSVQNGPSVPAINTAHSLKMSTVNTLKSPWIVERLKHLAKAYNDRGAFVKKAIENISDCDSSDTSDDESQGNDNTRRPHLQHASSVQSIFKDEFTATEDQRTIEYKEKMRVMRDASEKVARDSWCGLYRLYMVCLHRAQMFAFHIAHCFGGVYEPQSTIYILWLAILAFAFCYNAVIIVYRAVFCYQQQSDTYRYLIADTVFDLIYLIDILWFKSRLKFNKDGQWIDDPVVIRRHYYRRAQFRNDVLAILPIDLCLCVYYGGYNVSPTVQRLSRLNRMIKINSFWEFFQCIDAISTNYPYLFRIMHTLLYKVYVIHLGACAYYLSSAHEGFGATPWTYNNEGNAYLRCFYFAFRTSTSIGGKLPKPSTEFERIYMTFAWLFGVFVFAMVIGQIRDIVANAARNQNYYRDILNKTSNYLRVLNVPSYMQKRVRFWLNFTWELQKTFNENSILHVLPLKMRTDIALSVHYQTLSRVELFKNIDRSVLRDLVLKLQAVLFLPGDYVCRKGDVGHEMYIVNKGQIQVVGADGSVLITLGEGSVFGEIAILNLEGFTRRTADVRSVGYSQLFALRKADLWETLKNYPEYQAILKKKVQKILKKKRKQSQGETHDKASRSRKRKLRVSRQSTVVEETALGKATGGGEIIKEYNTEQEQQIAQQMSFTVEIGSEPSSTRPTIAIEHYDEDRLEAKDKVFGENELEFDNYDDDDDDDVFGLPLEVEPIVKERPQTPKLFDTVMEAVRPDSKVKFYFTRSQSISSQNKSSLNAQGQGKLSISEVNDEAKNEVKIKVEDDILL